MDEIIIEFDEEVEMLDGEFFEFMEWVKDQDDETRKLGGSKLLKLFRKQVAK